MNFFQHYLTTPYTLVDTAGTAYPVTITNIMLRAKLVERLRQHVSVFYEYDILDSERPDTVATKMYGDPKYTWVILLANNIFDLYDWPLTNEEFEQFLVSKYGSLATAQAVSTESWYYFDRAHVKVDYSTFVALSVADRGAVLPARYCFAATGDPVAPETYDAMDPEEQGVVETPYEHELGVNESKRRIKIVASEFLPALEREIRVLYRF